MGTAKIKNCSAKWYFIWGFMKYLFKFLPLWHFGYLMEFLWLGFLWPIKWRAWHTAGIQILLGAWMSKQLRVELLWHRKVEGPCTHAPFLGNFLPAWKLLGQKTPSQTFHFLDPPYFCGPLSAGRNLSTAWIGLIWGSICSTSFNISSRREWECCSQVLLCVQSHVVSEILISSHNAAFQRILHFFL